MCECRLVHAANNAGKKAMVHKFLQNWLTTGLPTQAADCMLLHLWSAQPS